MCYVHNQWYDISCATLYIDNFLKLVSSLLIFTASNYCTVNKTKDTDIEQIKLSDNCYCQNLPSASLLSENLNIKIYIFTIPSVVSYRCETEFCTL